ncbi:hypothetical protein SANTM175S_09133 [Streptomyces antimycoticus]
MSSGSRPQCLPDDLFGDQAHLDVRGLGHGPEYAPALVRKQAPVRDGHTDGLVDDGAGGHRPAQLRDFLLQADDPLSRSSLSIATYCLSGVDIVSTDQPFGHR